MQSESHFAVNLMRHMVTPTFVLDASGHVVLWNRACERLTGVMADRAENWVPMPFSNEMRYLAIDVGPVFDEQGELIAVVETMHDMTELKRSQDALRQTTIADALTGLGNRRHFDHRSSPTVSERYKNGIYNE